MTDNTIMLIVYFIIGFAVGLLIVALRPHMKWEDGQKQGLVLTCIFLWPTALVLLVGDKDFRNDLLYGLEKLKGDE